MNKTIALLAIASFSAAPLVTAQMTREQQAASTPDRALNFLMKGNKRFVAGQAAASQDILARRSAATQGQYPKAVILSCLDSRVPVESVFDAGIGDLFVGRVAGNIEDKDQLGSMEFATKLAGAKLVMVLGHTSCGAVRGACDNARLGHLTGILKKIRPAVDAVKKVVAEKDATSANSAFVDKVASENVRRTVRAIRMRSPILADLEESGQIKIVGAMFDLSSGKVTLLD